MNGLLRRLPAATLALTVALAIAQPNVAVADANDDRLFDQGATAIHDKNWSLAYERFSDLWKRKQSLDIAANLAVAETQLGKARDAAEHLAFALSVLPETSEPAVRERMQKDLSELEAKTGRLNFQCPEGTTIVVNGKIAGVMPLKTVYVDPGTVVVTGSHPEKGKGRAEVKVEAGGNVTAVFQLTPDEGGGGSEKPLWPGLLLGGVAAAGVGIGIGLTVVAFGQRSDAIDQAIACTPFRTACRNSGDSNLDSANALLGGGIAGLSIGGAALVGMAIYLAVPQASEAKTAVAPWLGPETAGFSIISSF